MARWWNDYRNEDNALARALALVSLKGYEKEVPSLTGSAFLLRTLDLYPEDQAGFGPEYWKKNSERVAEALGGGKKKKYAREPLPVSHRPKDSFLWQRNPRRLRGDFDKQYPGTDYLFLYWFSRYYGLIGDTPEIPTVSK